MWLLPLGLLAKAFELQMVLLRSARAVSSPVSALVSPQAAYIKLRLSGWLARLRCVIYLFCLLRAILSRPQRPGWFWAVVGSRCYLSLRST